MQLVAGREIKYLCPCATTLWAHLYIPYVAVVTHYIAIYAEVT